MNKIERTREFFPGGVISRRVIFRTTWVSRDSYLNVFLENFNTELEKSILI